MAFRAYDLLQLVREHGEPLTLRKKSYGAYDPASGTLSSSLIVDHGFTGYFYTYQLNSIDQINRGIRKCVIPALDAGVIPDDEDEILGNGDTVTINRVVTMYSAGSVVCHICDVGE